MTQPPEIYLERKDPQRNMARFYTMRLLPTLFGDIALIRSWGRLGTRGKTLIHHLATEAEALSLMHELLCQKERRGYI